MQLTMLMCDNELCRYNNDRVCARAKVYCIGRMCKSAKWTTYAEMQRNRRDDVKLRDRNPRKG